MPLAHVDVIKISIRSEKRKEVRQRGIVRRLGDNEHVEQSDDVLGADEAEHLGLHLPLDVYPTQR